MSGRADRFRPSPHGVYDTWGGYHIEQSLWDQRVREGRSPYANHDFTLGAPVTEPGIPAQWGRVNATCRRCGEHRLVFHGVRMDDLNYSWCIRPSWWQRLMGAIGR